MSKLSNAKLVLGDREKSSKNGKGTAAKKVFRKIAKKQTDVVGQLLSATVGNAPAVCLKPRVQKKTLTVAQGAVKKTVTLSAMKSPALKPFEATSERTPTIKSQKSRPLKKRRLVISDPNSATVGGKAETKRTKPVKRVSKAIPTTPTIATIATPTTETTISTMGLAVASHRLGGSKSTKPAEKRPAKRVVKRVSRKKLNSSLMNEKIADPKTAHTKAELDSFVLAKNPLSARK